MSLLQTSFLNLHCDIYLKETAPKMQCVFPCVAVAESSTLAPVTSVNVSATDAAYVDDQVVTTEGNADCELGTDSMQSSFGSDSDGDGGDDGNDGDDDDSSEFVPSEDSDGAAESGSDPVRDRKFIVFEENLNELLEKIPVCVSDLPPVLASIPANIATKPCPAKHDVIAQHVSRIE